MSEILISFITAAPMATAGLNAPPEIAPTAKMRQPLPSCRWPGRKNELLSRTFRGRAIQHHISKSEGKEKFGDEKRREYS